ncbi:hypothetical protein BH23GEM9_BH23GEM9_33000 [soil metagenome]
MDLHSYYRLVVWLPLLLPAGVALLVHGLDVHPGNGVLAKLIQIILVSGIYGGIPYAALASYATWWIDTRPGSQLRRRALVAPLWMVVVWLPFSALTGLLYGRIDTFVGFFGLGASVILPLGYAYVALVLLLEPLLCRAGSPSTLPP